MNLDLASTTSYDHLIVGGLARLNGTLDLTLESGFSAALGSIFHVISWSAVMGDFVGNV